MMEAPPADGLACAVAQLSRSVVDARPMPGGLDATMFRLRLDDSADVVLRIATPGEDDDVQQLARILDLLGPSDVPAPVLLARGAGVGPGEESVLLQTLLQGDPSLPLDPTQEWLRS